MIYLFFILGFFVGFGFFQIFSGKFEGDKIERSLRFLVNNYYIHIHHWLLASVILIILAVIHFYNLFIYGLLFGAVLQGLRYKDRFVIIYHKDRFTQIYSKFKN